MEPILPHLSNKKWMAEYSEISTVENFIVLKERTSANIVTV
jgi:hypothetical protein